MSVTAAQLHALVALGIAGDQLLAVVEVIEMRDAERDVRDAVRDGPMTSAERSKNYRDRVRHGDRHERNVTPFVTEVHIEKDTLTKKVRKKAISALVDVPEDASETNRTFAESKGWDTRKTASEWQRFRDHSLSKGKKHRNVDAAWRNWVTSPFQTTNQPNGKPPAKLVEPTGFYAAENSPELDAWDAHWRNTKGTNAPRDRNFGWRFETQWPPGYQEERAA